ncbi:HinfI family type II restriction enzyme [Campylobacter blaseri]|uniref:HinfI family type II restriction enzyme n=1 Tax=Campylobacter blaseri TaxID=2042961 RepID=UPI001F4E1FD7|nr:hypothetical protein [Campylobacter blaseri]
MQILVYESGNEILNISGKKNNKFSISKVIETKIDNYISKAQSDDNFNLNEEFSKLQDEILDDKSNDFITIKHDIDLIFKDKNDITYYVEIKYNDDHDTGKFIDINRKFIKTYAYLVRKFNISSKEKLIPILFYFNNKKMKGNIYIPEKTNIYRGKNFLINF